MKDKVKKPEKGLKQSKGYVVKKVTAEDFDFDFSSEVELKPKKIVKQKK